ncbi:SDR family oxidoreductase [Limnobacter humi]|uniref:SDR family oxidoreductase n=1 Tax=Limnobacter humi TaxID=1778671 RepID=A0ABT1WG10_9BURK|nr:SDR family oxidoreductase [Limnobacter humi]MCQ8896457.1 SDR family oxidoreductase [Limnobacter humi]
MKAIVTGHSRGLGKAICLELLNQGIPVLGLARTVPDSPVHPLLTDVALDLSDTPALLDWIDSQALRQYMAGAPAVVLINNAGVVEPIGPLHRQNPASIARAVQLNITAVLALSAACVQQRDGGQPLRIVHVSSGAARNPYPGWSVYCATKAALDMHAQAVAADQIQGLRICSLAPGVIDTDMQGEIRASNPDDFPNLARFKALKAQNQLQTPQDCAETLIHYVLGHRFGELAVADLRQIG